MNSIFFFQAEDGIRDGHVTGVQTCALPISRRALRAPTAGVEPPAAARAGVGTRVGRRRPPGRGARRQPAPQARRRPAQPALRADRAWRRLPHGHRGMNPRQARSSLAVRLVAAQLLVIVAGCVTLAVVALAVAPGLFRGHARAAFAVLPPGAVGHLQQGFQDAIMVALAIAAAASLATALAASWLLAQQLARPIRELAGAADRIGQGSYE